MDIADKVIIVTGGGNGIGKALCERFHEGGARKVVVADLEENSAKAVAATVDGDAYGVDVRDEAQMQAMVSEVEERHGVVDIFCSNAGIIALDGEPWWATSAPNKTWQAMWGSSRDVTCLCCSRLPAGDAGARRGLFSQHGLGRGAAEPGG